MELADYLAKVTDPVTLVLDLHIAHDRFGSCSDPNINGQLHYPNDLDGSLNETTTDKIRQYHTDYNKRPSNSISLMSAIDRSTQRLSCRVCCLETPQ